MDDTMHVVHPRAAGLDIHKMKCWVQHFIFRTKLLRSSSVTGRLCPCLLACSRLDELQSTLSPASAVRGRIFRFLPA